MTVKIEPKVVYEGWFTYGDDYEYGPTLVRWVGKGKPKNRKTNKDVFLNDNYEEIYITDLPGVSSSEYDIVKAKITVEIEEVIPFEGEIC
jgi:hypothetical protein